MYTLCMFLLLSCWPASENGAHWALLIVACNYVTQRHPVRRVTVHSTGPSAIYFASAWTIWTITIQFLDGSRVALTLYRWIFSKAAPLIYWGILSAFFRYRDFSRHCIVDSCLSITLAQLKLDNDRLTHAHLFRYDSLSICPSVSRPFCGKMHTELPVWVWCCAFVAV